MVDIVLADSTFEGIQIGLVIGLTAILTVVASRLLPTLISTLWNRFTTATFKEIYHNIVEPCLAWIQWAIALSIAELVVLLLPRSSWKAVVEIPLSLTLTIVLCWLSSRLFRQFFDTYLLEIAFKGGRKVNSEFLILAKFFVSFSVIVVAVIAFAQTHQINVVGLVASLGIGGLAIAFAAQKTLEQFLGGIVLYIDRPFVVDDYIGLPDGTFGRVESIGLRSTKVRTSGKGTLVIVPNSALTQVTIENFTGVKKVMSIIYLTFYRVIPYEEQALIRQVILNSTSDIFGLDTQSTDLSFKELPNQPKTQAQITFFILGSGDVSMELRRQLLDIASQNITQRLKEYGIAFDIEEPTIYVDSPITI
ncbi:mechanosensitive ion channel [Oculatella sp. LEGE 06141]|uniref:mechanosensitive ion channel family protein n=1 Tax=Oculatella sp. LEGE 06141 TaxID=1828648 RepID=UPI00187F3EB6|nr:mechanosensitive ion channel domain-containing protein [Oculatella sp. LEGE 06141]MBE9177436.1 mechanosensitive ion channel [Oculatella sp. LEGE 06141]